MSGTREEARAARSARVTAGLLTAGAGLLGGAGVAVSAAATHAGGGALATTAGLFCLLHAAAVLGLAAAVRRTTTTIVTFGVSATMLLAGTTIFSADLAVAGFTGLRPIPLAAPIGGVLMIAGWLVVVIAGVMETMRADRGPASGWTRQE